MENKFLGKLYYYDSVRVNLGLFQHDVNVIWDLATHDFSIMNYLLGSRAQAVSAVGACHVNELEDVGYITVFFDNNFVASSLVFHGPLFELQWSRAPLLRCSPAAAPWHAPTPAPPPSHSPAEFFRAAPAQTPRGDHGGRLTAQSVPHVCCCRFVVYLYYLYMHQNLYNQ